MKSCLCLALLAVSTFAAAQTAAPVSASAAPKTDISSLGPPAHPCTEAQIREYLTLNHGFDNAHRLMQQNLHNERAVSTPYLTPGFWDDMEKAMSQVDLAKYFIPAYQKYLSEEDMASVIAFYKTPAGKRILAAQPFIESAIDDTASKAGKQIAIEVGKKHEAEIRRLAEEGPIPPQRNQAEAFEVHPAD